MDLTLKEKLIILAYDPVKGNNLASNFIGYGIGGAILLELAALKRISIEKNKIHLVDGHKTGDIFLDEVMGIIGKYKRDLKVKALIGMIQRKQARFRKPLLTALVDKRYLREERKRFLVFPYKRFPSAKRSYRQELVDQIRRLVLRNEASDNEISMLIGLAGACRFSHRFFHTKEEKRIAKGRIKEIIKESQVDKAIDETIKAVQAAVMISVTTAAAVSTSH